MVFDFLATFSNHNTIQSHLEIITLPLFPSFLHHFHVPCPLPCFVKLSHRKALHFANCGLKGAEQRPGTPIAKKKHVPSAATWDFLFDDIFFEGVSGIWSFKFYDVNLKASNYEKKSKTCDIWLPWCPRNMSKFWGSQPMVQFIDGTSLSGFSAISTNTCTLYTVQQGQNFHRGNFKSSNFKTQEITHAEIRIPHNLVCC